MDESFDEVAYVGRVWCLEAGPEDEHAERTIQRSNRDQYFDGVAYAGRLRCLEAGPEHEQAERTIQRGNWMLIPMRWPLMAAPEPGFLQAV